MEVKKIIAGLALALLWLPTLARAQTYSFQTTQVTSTTVPVNIMPAGTRNTWGCKIISGTNGVRAWSYVGTLPTFAPANTAAIGTTDGIGDGVTVPAWNSPMQSNDAVGQAWAAVLTTNPNITPAPTSTPGPTATPAPTPTAAPSATPTPVAGTVVYCWWR